MATERAQLAALKRLISEADHVLATTPELPENRTAAARESLAAAIALADDLLKQARTPAATVLGRKGGTTTSLRHGVELPPDGGQTQNSWWGRPKKEPS